MTSPIVHFEIAGPDDEVLHRFYTSLFGWPINAMGPGYALIETTAGSPNGAVREAQEPELTIGIGVDDLHQAVESASASGGKVVMPPTDNGYVHKAQITDPAGNLLTLIENTKPDV
jgi:predicted enzyme related to lactoylglutathione lyase